MATATAAPATTCPTCGSAVRVVSDDREGTSYYLPMLTGAQVDAAERMAWSIRNDDPQGFDLAARDFADAGTGDPTPLIEL